MPNSIQRRQGQIATRLIAFAILLAGALAPSRAEAFDLVVRTLGGGAPAEFSYLINEDNTNVPILDENTVGPPFPPAAPPATGPMASYSPIAAAGDQSSAGDIALSGDPAICGQAASYANDGSANGCRYLITVRAPGHKLWGQHIRVDDAGSVFDSDGNDLGGTVTIALRGNPLPLSSLEVLVFEDFAEPNGFPDHPFEADITGSVTDMSGFHILLGDGTGEVVVDWFGNPICGTGRCITDAKGRVLIENLPHGKLEIEALPPDGSDWLQTTTFEGTRTVDAWLEEGSDGKGAPGELLREPGVDTAHFFGFVSADGRDTLCGGSGTITGTARNLVPFPPFETLTFGEAVVEPWIAVTDLNQDRQVCVQRGNADGTFSIDVPPGLYQLMIFDQFLDYINAFYTVAVADGTTVSPGFDPGCDGTSTSCSVGVFRWWGWNSGHVFLDLDEDAVRDPGEFGIPNLEVVARARDGSLLQGAVTDSSGFYEMNEIRNLLTKMYNLEVDFGRFDITGHSAHDEQFALFNNLDPSPDPVDPDAGGGLILSQSTWEGRRSIVDWGKGIYRGTENGGISGIVFQAVTRNEFDAALQAAEDYEPGIPNVTVRIYSTLKDGSGQLLLDSRGLAQADVLLNEVQTDNWVMPRSDNPDNPVACDVRQADGSPMPGPTPAFIGQYCIEVPQIGNETKPGAYDGGWAFGDICPPGIGFPCDEADLVGPIPPDDYIVEVVPPPFYQVVKEEDNNTAEGNDLVPQFPPPPCVGADHLVTDISDEFPGFPFGNQMRPLCDQRWVTLQAQQNPGLDIFLFTTDEPGPEQQPNGERVSWTSAQSVPPPGRFMGLVEDDINLNRDENSLTFGEKRSVPGLPIGIYEFSDDASSVGRRLTTVFTDANGFYEVLLPSSATADSPIPGGVSPQMYVMVVNDPGPDPANPNPGFSKAFLTEPVVREVQPGKMTKTDTPVDPVNALTCGVPPDAPQIFQISTPVVPFGSSTNITITGMRFGNCPGSPGGAGSGDPCPFDELPTVTLDDNDGVDDAVELTIANYMPANPFDQTAPAFEDVIEVTVPGGFPEGPAQLTVISGPIGGFITFPGAGPISVNGGGLSSRNGMTIHVTGHNYPVGSVINVSPPGTPGDPAIQSAIDGASPGDLIVVAPGTYRENIIIDGNIKLQGHGPGGAVGIGRLELQDFPCPTADCPPVTLPGEEPFTNIPGSVIDGRFFAFSAGKRAAWNAILAGISFDGPGTVPSGAAITVLLSDGETGAEGARLDDAEAPQIDGLGISGGRGEAGGGIYIHAFGRNYIISNNILESNSGTHGGAISLGQPGARGGERDHQNDDIRIRHNRILDSGGVFFAGAVGVFAGATGYDFGHNDVCGGFSGEYGGGFSHWGLSEDAQIHDNRFYYNDAVDEGGGVIIAGDPGNLPDGCTEPDPALGCSLGRGSGRVTFERNLVQANLSNDDGGGLRLLNTLESRIDIFNNELVNNVATDHGGGVSMDNASEVRMVNNSVAGNVSTHTAEDSILGEAHAAGLSVEPHNIGFMPSDGSTFSDPVLFNNVFHDNLAYRWDEPAAQGLQLVPTAFIDLEVFGGGVGDCLDVHYSFLSGPPQDPVGGFCPVGTGNIVGDGGVPDVEDPPEPLPGFVNPLQASLVEILVAPGRFNADELVPFLDRPEGTLVGFTDYHLQVGSPAIGTGSAGSLGAVGGPATEPIGSLSWPAEVLPPDDDIDLDRRPQPFPLGRFDMGSDESTGAPTSAGVLQFVFPAGEGGYEVLETAGSVTVTVRRTGDDVGAVTVDFRTEDVAAMADEDYVATSGTLSWANGDNADKTFDITILDDDVFEDPGDELFFVVLSNVTGDATLANGQPELFGAVDILDNEVAPAPAQLYFSTLGNFAVPGLSGPHDDADVYSWDGSGFARIFDASAEGLPGSADVDALVVEGSGGFIFYLSFQAPTAVPGLGTVDDSDVVRYDQQAGTWTLFFDGSDVGLTANGEDIDAFEILSQGGGGISVLVSTNGNPSLPGVSGDADEDLLLCTGTSGAATACTWSLRFDGSDIGLNDGNAEDVGGAAVSGGSLRLTTRGDLSVSSGGNNLAGGENDVFSCDSATTGTSTSCGGLTLLFDGAAAGITNELDAIDVP